MPMVSSIENLSFAIQSKTESMVYRCAVFECLPSYNQPPNYEKDNEFLIEIK